MLPKDLLPTKIYLPQIRTEIVTRQNLIDLIIDSYKSKTILVSAPAGFGKTTLICNWIRQLNIPAAWYSIGQEDNDPTSFLSYVIAALQTVDQDIGLSTHSLQELPNPETKLVLTNLISDIIQGDREIVLVFDDYHLIKEREVHDLLEFLIEHKPVLLHLVIVSRSDPLLPIHRYRARDQLTEIRAANLSFSDSDAYAFFNKVMGLNLTSVDASELNKRTEGWITGLQMAALSMKSHPDIEGFIRSFTGDNRYVMDYLVEEVIAVQEEMLRTFLMQTSILGRFSGDLSEAVTGIKNCQAIIEELDSRNLFLVRLDDKNQWYRYHHLFAELLKKKLNDTEPDRIPDLHIRASKWFSEHDFIPEALEHSIEAQDWNNAAQLVERTFMDRMSRGEDYPTMLDRMQALPEEMIRSSPSLFIMYAWMYSITLQLDEAEKYLKLVEEKEGESLNDQLAIQIEVVRASIARYRGKHTEAIRSSLNTLEKIASNPSDSHVQRQNYTGSIIYLAWSYYSIGEMELAMARFREALGISQEVGSINLLLYNLTGISMTQSLMGQLAAAHQTLTEGLTHIQEYIYQNIQPHSASALIYIEYGNYLRETNQLEKAEKYTRQGLELGMKRSISAEILRDGYILLSRIKCAQNKPDDCWKILQEAEQVLAEFMKIDGFRDSLDTWNAILAMSIFNKEVEKNEYEHKILNDWVSRQEIKPEPIVDSITAELNYLLWARWLIYSNKTQDARNLLDHLMNNASEKGRYERLITMHILRSIACEALGQTQEALSEISLAIRLAEPEGYSRIFTDEGILVKRILKKISASEILDKNGNKLKIPLSYVNKLLLCFEAGYTLDTKLEKPFTLSKREMDVLMMLSTGISNAEISERLFISKDTVKSHLKSINVKLDTVDRKHAVEKARELGLI
jgi:LuxR family maltose regulon positive regulatory protein